MKTLEHIFPVNRENFVMGMIARRYWIIEKDIRNQVEKLVRFEDKVEWATSK